MVFLDPLARLEREHAANQARVTALEEEIAQREGQPQESASFDALVAADEEVQALRRKAIIAKGVADNSATRLADAIAAEAERTADAAHKTEEKAAEADRKLVRAPLATLEKLIAEIEAVDSSVQRTEQYNARRGERPFIPDAETRVRQRPGELIPAAINESECWMDEAGNPVPATIWDHSNFKHVHNPSAVRHGLFRRVEREAIQLTSMPKRLAKLLPELRKALGR